jgi:hypothetical protein
VNRPRWNGEDLAGQTILLHSEQGLGDTLQFVRFAPHVKRRGGRVVVACPESLVRLVTRCRGIDEVVDWLKPLPDYDVQCSLLSLPAVLHTTLANLPAEVPYLFADARTIVHWRTVVECTLGLRHSSKGGVDDRARVFKIGIAWQGNRENKVDRFRSFPLAFFAAVAALPSVRLISLQKGEGTNQLAELNGRFPVAVLNDHGSAFGDERDFLDTAAVMSGLDLVITPETAVAHVAGGLGVRVWVPLSTVGDWRWLIDREDSPWYPTMRLFRQSRLGDWQSVFDRIARALAQELAS